MFGPIIRQRREALGLSQAEVAARVGYSQGFVSDVEVGRRTNMKLATLQRIAGSLHLRLLLVPEEQAERCAADPPQTVHSHKLEESDAA